MKHYTCDVCGVAIDFEKGIREDYPRLVSGNSSSFRCADWARGGSASFIGEQPTHCCSIVCVRKVIDGFFEQEAKRLERCRQADEVQVQQR